MKTGKAAARITGAARKGLYLFLILLAISLAGCSAGKTAEPTSVRSIGRSTQAEPSRQATQTGLEQVSQITEPKATQPPAGAPTATSEMVSTEINTSPTSPATPVPLAATPTAAASCSNLAEAGEPLHITIPDGTQVLPGETFTKMWRLKNSGTCTWTADYVLVWVSGADLKAPASQRIGQAVGPGETVDLAVSLTAPEASGDYQSDWLLKSTSAEIFGIGSQEATLWTRITVISTATATPGLANLSGKLLLNGAPAAGVVLSLEDASGTGISTAVTQADGSYTFSGIPSSTTGYSVTFAQSANTQFDLQQVASWVWLGPVVTDGEDLQLPDLEIALQGFGQVNPEPEAEVSAAGITAATPLTFEWGAYPQATQYWVDLTQGEGQALVWQSGLTNGTSVAFDGSLTDGTHITPGEYWWGVGAQAQINGTTQTRYSFLAKLLVVEP